MINEENHKNEEVAESKKALEFDEENHADREDECSNPA
jgi:hypothetical protein